MAGVAVMTGASAQAAEHMVGVRPSDGVAMFVKRFAVRSGTTVVGAQFRNNDSRTVFPEVVLVRGGTSALGEGSVVARAANVLEVEPGWVRVTWITPVVAARDEVYYLAVRIPSGPGKRGPADGPGLGATSVPEPNGSFLAVDSEGTLVPVAVDLSAALVTAGAGKAQEPDDDLPLASFLDAIVPNPSPGTARVQFGVARPAAVRLRVYDVGGRLVRDLGAEALAAGRHEREWDGRDARGRAVAAGIYVLKLSVGTEDFRRRIVVVR